MPADNGPYLAVAVICERILVEKDDVISLVRIFDRLTIKPPSENTPTPSIPFWLAISFRAGRFRGKVAVTMKMISPSNQTVWESTASLTFLNEKDDEQASNLLGNLNVPAAEEGTYWLEVALENKTITQVPLRIVHERDQPAAVPGQ